MQYQERLKNWEAREHKKQKELDREGEKEKMREVEREREARRLKEFLEDYDDERDDHKYYKGHAFQRKLLERDHEKEIDTKDRVKEKEELEELKAKILAEGHDNPEEAYEQACHEREELYKPKILYNLFFPTFNTARQEREELYKPKLLLKPAEKPPPPSSPPSPPSPSRPASPPDAFPLDPPPKEPQPPPAPHDHSNHAAPLHTEAVSESDEDSIHSDRGGGAPSEAEEEEDEEEGEGEGEREAASQETATAQQDENSLSRDAFSSAETTPMALPTPKRKKLDVKDVFNQDDDDAPAKKKKLLPLPGKESGSASSKPKEKGGEEKRKHIKSLIDKIPTSKAELFAYPIDASLVDNLLMEKRIRPWINKKIIEYIGEPEPTLVDFICSKVLVGSEPQSLLNDVQMVLDDEAEVFVVKMWRLLIYEIEAKKMGLGKT